MAQFPKTALMMSVLTPRYVESDWCTREVREFCAAAEHRAAWSSRTSSSHQGDQDASGKRAALPAVMKEV